jgi:hypothetical protein
MNTEYKTCPALNICQKLGNLGHNCSNVIPPYVDDEKESTYLKKISFQLQEVKDCLHSVVLLLDKK